MIAWRICRSPFADLSGTGARIHGGRWNSPGHPVIYAAETAALAVLEVRVHLDLTPDLLPDDYVLVGIDTGDLEIAGVADMPSDPRAAGDTWLKDQRAAVLKVPSFIVPESFNLLLNPLHPDAGGIAIVSKRAFSFDERLWRPLFQLLR